MTVINTGWDEEADVVILGCGGAGAVAAITASDAGAKVVVVEKGEGGGNTRLATMAFLCPTNNSAAREHIKALSFGMLGEDIIDVYVEWTAKNIDYESSWAARWRNVFRMHRSQHCRVLKLCCAIGSKPKSKVS